MRYVVIARLVMIVESLASAAVFMFRDRTLQAHGESARLRVGLSVALFVFLMPGILGLIQENSSVLPAPIANRRR